MSKSLIKLVDNSLFPAAIMIIGKFAGIVLTIHFLNIPIALKDYTNNIFTFTAPINTQYVTTITSYSDLIMFFLLAVFFSATIIRAVYLHNSHIKPTLVAQLANKNLLNLVQNSYEIYHSTAVWLLFVIISNILIIVDVLSGKTFGWIGIATTITSILLSVILLQDVYREIENIKHNPGQYNWK